MQPKLDKDLFLTTLYCLIDDTLRTVPQARPPGVGRPQTFTDSEVLTLAVLAQFVPRFDERTFLAWVRFTFRGAFARLPSQSAYNRRVRDLWGVLAWLGPALPVSARGVPALAEHVLTLDATGVSLLSMNRGERGKLYGDDAAVGRGTVDKTWFYGVKLTCVVSNVGLIHGFVSAAASTEERFVVENLWRFALNPAAPALSPDDGRERLSNRHRTKRVLEPPRRVGPCFGVRSSCLNTLVLADDGYAGQAWQAHWARQYGVTVVTTQQAREQGREAWFSAQRQVVETTFSRLHDFFALDRPKTKSTWGWWTRLSAKIAAHNALIVFNAFMHRPLGAYLNLLALP